MERGQECGGYAARWRVGRLVVGVFVSKDTMRFWSKSSVILRRMRREWRDEANETEREILVEAVEIAEPEEIA
jgi:hypothetical protein